MGFRPLWHNFHLYTETLVCMWLREFYSCSCLTVLPDPAWVLLSKTCKPLFTPQYRNVIHRSCCLKFAAPKCKLGQSSNPPWLLQLSVIASLVRSPQEASTDSLLLAPSLPLITKCGNGRATVRETPFKSPPKSQPAKPSHCPGIYLYWDTKLE